MSETLTAAQYREVTKQERHGRIPRAPKSRRTVGNIVFDSLAEAKRYQVLKLAEIAGRISNLTLQPKYALICNGTHVGTYYADFEYLNETGLLIVEDVKSAHTRKDPVYRLKKKMVQAIYGIEIKEVMQ